MLVINRRIVRSFQFLCQPTLCSIPYLYELQIRPETFIDHNSGYGSLHSSVTSQPKTIGHFTAYPKQIEFDFGHFTAYYLLVGVCCPRGFDLCCEFDLFIDLDLIKNCDVV